MAMNTQLSREFLELDTTMSHVVTTKMPRQGHSRKLQYCIRVHSLE